MLNIDQLKHDHDIIFLKLFKKLIISQENDKVIYYKRNIRCCFKYYKDSQNFYIRKREYKIFMTEYSISGLKKKYRSFDNFLRKTISKHLKLDINLIRVIQQI